MKSFIKISGVLFLLLFQFTSCLKEDDNRKPVYLFYDEPVVVNQLGDNPLIRNESYLFSVPELAGDTALKAGDLLWTSFIVDLDNQANTNPLQYTAKSFQYRIVDSAKVIIPADTAEFQSYLSDEYSSPIESSVLYPYAIDSLWFFGFRQREYSMQQAQSNFIYELILNPTIEKDGNSYPTLYIRAKQTDASASTASARSRDGYLIFAFDAADFVKYWNNMVFPANVLTDRVRFNLKYKTGVDANGKDIYRSFMSNPIAWDFNRVKPV